MKILKIMHELYFLKAKQYGDSNNIIVKDVFLKGKSIYVKGIDKNRDRFGNEYGEFTQLYYSFIKGRKRKNVIGDSLALTTEKWVDEMKKIHPEYDYTITQYVNNRQSVKIICPKHGVFSVMPKIFAKPDYQCGKCKKDNDFEKRKEIVYEKLKKIHPKYVFCMDEFKNVKTKIKIICPEHGEFWQTPKLSLKGCICPKCATEKNAKRSRMGIRKFMERAYEIHGDKYDYSKVEYVNNETDVCIICPEHGEFWQTPKSHLKSGGCPKCSNTYIRTQNDFIQDAYRIHGGKYDYSKVEYVDMNTKVCIICHEKDGIGRCHGEFWQTPKLHLMGYGCKKCSGFYVDKKLFIYNSQRIHGDKYDYSKVEYSNSKTKVCIICPEHGEFWQEPSSHLNGRGCPLCKSSHLEREMKQFLEEQNINFVYQYHNLDIFERQSLDFYLPDYNIAIECQGEQHYVANFFKSKGIEYTQNHLLYIQNLDKRKKEICENNGITLLYYLNKKFLKYIKGDKTNCYSNKNDLLKRINEK